MPHIRILLADDHKILRDGLKELLNQNCDMQVVAEAADGSEAVRLAREFRPDVIVMDLMMPVMNGIEATRLIAASCPATRVVALSMYSDSRFVLETLKAGALGFLLKDCAFDDLVEAVRAAAAGRVFLAPPLSKTVAEIYVNELKGVPQEHQEQEGALSPRELEVLRLLVKGNTNKEVAALLHLSSKTVANHRHNIMKKLGVKNAVELTTYAINKRLIPDGRETPAGMSERADST